MVARFPDISPGNPTHTGFHRAPVPCLDGWELSCPQWYPGSQRHPTGAPLTVADQRRNLTGFPSWAVATCLSASVTVTRISVATTGPIPDLGSPARSGAA